MTRNEAIQWLKAERKVRGINGECQITDALDMAIEALSEPSIVRCGECKHFNDGDCTELPKLVSETDFCSFGERREP